MSADNFSQDALIEILERIVARKGVTGEVHVMSHERRKLQRMADCRPGFRKTIEKLGITSKVRPRRIRTKVIYLWAA